jgi:hypothetical protein
VEFDVDATYLSKFEPKKFGGAAHVEYWIPAVELEEFNQQIRGKIRMIKKFERPK